MANPGGLAIWEGRGFGVIWQILGRIPSSDSLISVQGFPWDTNINQIFGIQCSAKVMTELENYLCCNLKKLNSVQ